MSRREAVLEGAAMVTGRIVEMAVMLRALKGTRCTGSILASGTK